MSVKNVGFRGRKVAEHEQGMRDAEKSGRRAGLLALEQQRGGAEEIGNQKAKGKNKKIAVALRSMPVSAYEITNASCKLVPFFSTPILIAKNRSITAAFVVKCCVGAGIVNRPLPASASGKRS